MPWRLRKNVLLVFDFSRRALGERRGGQGVPRRLEIIGTPSSGQALAPKRRDMRRWFLRMPAAHILISMHARGAHLSLYECPWRTSCFLCLPVAHGLVFYEYPVVGLKCTKSLFKIIDQQLRIWYILGQAKSCWHTYFRYQSTEVVEEKI